MGLCNVFTQLRPTGSSLTPVLVLDRESDSITQDNAAGTSSVTGKFGCDNDFIISSAATCCHLYQYSYLSHPKMPIPKLLNCP